MSEPKPPIGLRPRKIWLIERRKEILEAIERYEEAKWLPPDKWILEHNKIVEEIYRERI